MQQLAKYHLPFKRGTWFIHMYGICTYILLKDASILFWKQVYTLIFKSAVSSFYHQLIHSSKHNFFVSFPSLLITVLSMEQMIWLRRKKFIFQQLLSHDRAFLSFSPSDISRQLNRLIMTVNWFPILPIHRSIRRAKSIWLLPHQTSTCLHIKIIR